MNVEEFLRIAFFIEQFWLLLLNFFTGSQKERVFSIHRSVRKTFKCFFPIDFAFNMSMQCSERTPKPETIFYSVDFLAVIINRYFLFLYLKKHIAFMCVNTPLFLLPFIIFTVLLPFSINFEFNFGLNFNAVSFFHLNCKNR